MDQGGTKISLNLYLFFSICIALSVIVIYPTTASGAGITLVPKDAIWSYLDNGSDQGVLWRESVFDDSTWLTGPSELGYGDGDEATVVDFGPDPNNKYITTYFRHAFNVTDISNISGLTLNLLRDDGAVVYLNGTEVFRSNMPADQITASTLASLAVGGVDETVFHETCVNPALLVNGTNVLAVEIHQFNVLSSDISFNLELTSSPVTRGPYLQTGTPTSMTLRWRTCDLTDSRVRYGLDPGNLNNLADDATPTTEHEILLTGLNPDTQYYYSVGTSTQSFEGGDTDHFFVTSPLQGTAKPTRIWVIGDSGTANANAQAVRDAYLSYTGTSPTDLWLMLGDNAYLSGTDEQYQAAVFDMYPMLLRNSVVWPALGNHDAEPLGSSSSNGTGPYFDMFTLPSMGEAGGLASGTEAYYSFDYGNIHFINLNSTGSDRSVGGAMLTWLESDLAATSQDWIIAYWHHSPYSHGSHDSDNPLDSGGRMFDMRENVLPILEAYGVDIVLTGHSHSYERSFLLNGHYGTSDTLTPPMILDAGDGRMFGDGMYAKATLGPGANEGAVYSVVGSSGLISGGALDHPAMFVSMNVLGSMVLDVDGNRLDVNFIDDNGTTRDNFTLIKGPRSDAIPDIKANGMDGPVVIPQGDNLTVSVTLDAGDYEGDPADWWILMYYYNTDPGLWVPFNITNFQASIFNLSPVDIINTTGLPVGHFLFYYSVDTNPNGVFDADQMFSDLVVVETQ